MERDCEERERESVEFGGSWVLQLMEIKYCLVREVCFFLWGCGDGGGVGFSFFFFTN